MTRQFCFKRRAATWLWMGAGIAAVLFSLQGCATRYVERDTDKDDAADAIGDVVVSKTSEDFIKNPPLCLGIMPLGASKREFEPTQDLRKALHAHLAPTGIQLLPLQRVDGSLVPGQSELTGLQAVYAATGCDTLMTGDISERLSRFWGVYSEKDSDLSQDAVARQAAHSSSIPGLAGRPSPHSFVSGIEQRPTAQLGPLIAAALSGDQWPEPADRLVLAQFWLNKEPQSSQSLFELASARFALGEATAALSLAQKAIKLNASLPEYHFLQGRIYLQLDQPAMATQAMLKAASAPGPKAIYFRALGVAYNQVGDYAMAAAALSRSLALEPGAAYAHLQIGVALVGIGDDSAAAKALRQRMILSIADRNHKNAARALATFKAMDLQAQLSSEKLEALEVKIGQLLTS